MFDVEKVYEAIRTEGINQGIPTTFIKFGSGPSYNSLDELMAELYPSLKTTLVCFCGEDTTRVGMGALIQALKELKCSVEIIYSGEHREPGWFNSVDTWMIDYTKPSYFSFGRLRPKDSVRFKIPEIRPELLLSSADSLGMCSAIRIVSLVPEYPLNDPEILTNFGKCDRLRVCRRQE